MVPSSLFLFPSFLFDSFYFSPAILEISRVLKDAGRELRDGTTNVGEERLVVQK
jgi:hypothetical protein